MTLIRAILTFRDPKPQQLLGLANMLRSCASEHNLYLAHPAKELILYSSDMNTTQFILDRINKESISTELLRTIQKDLLDIRHFETQDTAAMRRLSKAASDLE